MGTAATTDPTATTATTATTDITDPMGPTRRPSRFRRTAHTTTSRTALGARARFDAVDPLVTRGLDPRVPLRRTLNTIVIGRRLPAHFGQPIRRKSYERDEERLPRSARAVRFHGYGGHAGSRTATT